MRLVLAAALIFFGLGTEARAADEFRYPANHCAKGQDGVSDVRSGDSGMLLGTSAWAEAGACLKIPIERLTEAARNIDVMTWQGTTRVVGVDDLSRQEPSRLMDIRVNYEARHENLFVCHTADWPMVWNETVTRGSRERLEVVNISADRVPGGNSDGGYIKYWVARIELQRDSASATSLHMRYEITAPGQDSHWAAGAIKEYVDRLAAVANGGKALGAKPDPDCPY